MPAWLLQRGNKALDVAQIRELANVLKEAGLTKLEVTDGPLKIRLEKQTVRQAIPERLMPEEAPVRAEARLEAIPEPVDFNRVTEIKAPMVGVFYAAPAPEAEPFVQRGGRVKRGDVLCIIEAMKLLNEITAEADGEIADICVENGQVVEFSQTLFKIC